MTVGASLSRQRIGTGGFIAKLIATGAFLLFVVVHSLRAILANTNSFLRPMPRRADGTISTARANTEPSQLVLLQSILDEAFSAASARADAHIDIGTDERERDRWRYMGKTPLTNLSRLDCKADLHNFTGIPWLDGITAKTYRQNQQQQQQKQKLKGLRCKPDLTNSGQCQGGTGGESQQTCRRLLLIVLFNWPLHHQNSVFIRRLYEDAFSNIVFYSETGHPKYGVRPAPRIRRGTRQHVVVAQAILEHPCYDGYMWIGDDVLLNFPYVLTQLNTSKVWTLPVSVPWEPVFPHPGHEQVFPHPGREQPTPKWAHWDSPDGLKAVRKMYHCIRPKYIQRMPTALKCGYHCLRKVASDVGYIPTRFAKEFIELSFVFRNVYHEIALPNILRLIVPDMKHDFSMRPDTAVYAWEGGQQQRFNEVKKWFNETSTYAHPVKYSLPGAKEYALQQLNKSLHTHTTYLATIQLKPLSAL